VIRSTQTGYNGIVRLSERQRNALFGALEEVELPPGSEVYLFGSRVDPQRMGGDVDVLIVGEIEDAYSTEQRLRRAYQSRLDERVDIVILNKSSPDPDRELFVRTLQTERIA
jgi:predicted nucleotidyltransferase